MKYYLIAFILFINTAGFAQKQKAPTQRNIQLYVNNQSIQATVLIKEKKIEPQEAIDYYWYYNNEIKSNKGGYSGKLLTGNYQATDKKGNLLEQGFFKEGTKNGVWKTWNDDGELLTINIWKKGVKSGEYKTYKLGHLVEKGNYSKNKLNSTVYTYEADTVVSKTKYKNGKVIPVKVKKLKAEKEESSQEKEKTTESKKQWWKFWRKNEDKTTGTETEVKENAPKKEKTEKVKKEKNNPIKTTSSEKEKKPTTNEEKNKSPENKTKQPKKTKKTTKKEEVKPKQK